LKTTQDLHIILGHFIIEKKDYSFRPINQGFINDTFLVMAEETPLFILQRVNHIVFENVTGLMKNIGTALDFLQDQVYTRITLVETAEGSTFTKIDENYWRLMTYIDGTTAYDTTTQAKIASGAGTIVGKFHQLLEKAPYDEFVDTIPKFHDLSLRKNQFESALLTTAEERKNTAEKAIIFAQETLPLLLEFSKRKIPVRICHNDTKLNNILFKKEGNQALCLIDLDTIMKGYFYYDFGDAVRTIVNTAPEDEQQFEKITFENTLFEAFVDGIAGVEPFLTQEEINTLPLGAVFMPFIHGLRALTDYLMGNVYYKVAYENQNLDRCLSLFDFSKKALDKVTYMEETVSRKLTARGK
tara:strand:+ start:36306 stop:37373 length:1068 start_codon:yes stop_codon:yes gene_type:complete